MKQSICGHAFDSHRNQVLDLRVLFWRNRNHLYLFLCEYFLRSRLILAGTQMSFIERTYSAKKLRNNINLVSHQRPSLVEWLDPLCDYVADVSRALVS